MKSIHFVCTSILVLLIGISVCIWYSLRPHIPSLQQTPQPEGIERINGLIRDLELVNEHPHSVPGGVDPMDSPIVRSLVEEGDSAVEPLLKCFEYDNRMTRSYGGSLMRPQKPEDLIPVRSMALSALYNFFHTREFGNPSSPNLTSEEARHYLAKRIRAYWKRTRGKTRLEVAYENLMDDNASPGQWGDAAYYIVQPSNMESSPGSRPGNGSWMEAPLRVGEIAHMKGEPLRSRTNPSVSDLMAKRLKQVEDQNQGVAAYEYPGVCNFATYLAEWGGKDHLDDFRNLTSILETRLASPYDSSKDALVAPLLVLLSQRIDLGDSLAPSEWAAAIFQYSPPSRSVWPDGNVLKPLWSHADDPTIAATAEKLFSDPKYGWIDTNGTKLNDNLPLDEIHSTLIGNPSFRKLVLKGLNNQAKAGTIILDTNGFINEPWLRHGELGDRNDPDAPPSGSKIDVRVCDLYAHEISHIIGAPKCLLYWPEGKRNAAVGDCIAFLNKYGDNLNYKSDSPPLSTFPYELVQLHFPKLDHPATTADVTTGRAIFSLGGSPRLVPLPKLPFPATWTALKNKPTGMVWQAEEVQVNGKWERYYGFSGNAGLYKVRASEITFNCDPQGNVTKNLICRIEEPQPTKPVEMMMGINFNHIPMSDPIRYGVSIYNNSGLDQPVPSTVMLPMGATNVLPEGISITVTYSPKSAPLFQSIYEPAFDYGPFKELPMSTKITVSKSEIHEETLAPLEKLTLLDVDLRNFFEMRRPGSYRVKTIFHLPGQTATQSSEICFSLDK